MSRIPVAQRKIAYLIEQGCTLLSDDGDTATLRKDDRIASVSAFGRVDWTTAAPPSYIPAPRAAVP